jgi:hypothetical protein
VARVVPDAREPIDDLGNARQRPDIGGKPLRARPGAQGLLHLRELRRIQLRLPPGPAGAFESRPAALFPGVVPVVRGDPGDSQRLRHHDL